MQRSACGASADAACDCGVAYVPASKRAEAAIAASPGKSDRAIAEEIGVNQSTVSRARKRTDADASVVKRHRQGWQDTEVAEPA
jgi:IS30 family transposase